MSVIYMAAGYQAKCLLQCYSTELLNTQIKHALRGEGALRLFKFARAAN